jgi:hypothetical protein
VLHSLGEDPQPSSHPLITRVEVEPLSRTQISGLTSRDDGTLRLELDEHVHISERNALRG